jgi:Tfp pilus assembly protein PilV
MKNKIAKPKNNMRFTKYIYNGQSLFEVILALAVSAMILTGIVTLTSKSVSTSTISKNKSQANKYASEAMEYLRKEKEFQGWDVFSTTIGAGGDWCMSTLSLTDPVACSSSANPYITDTIFQRSLNVSDLTGKSMNIKIKVSWTDEKGLHETYTESVISDY